MNTKSKDTYTNRFRKYVREVSEIYDSTLENKNNQTNTKKRTYECSFGTRDYDLERYGQCIDAEFFQTNIGHAVMGHAVMDHAVMG